LVIKLCSIWFSLVIYQTKSLAKNSHLASKILKIKSVIK
jgi:hypothetical protein